MLYYIRSNEDDIIGFKYNNHLYYYVKNIKDDIIGIVDSNYNITAYGILDINLAIPVAIFALATGISPAYALGAEVISGLFG